MQQVALDERALAEDKSVTKMIEVKKAGENRNKKIKLIKIK